MYSTVGNGHCWVSEPWVLQFSAFLLLCWQSCHVRIDIESPETALLSTLFTTYQRRVHGYLLSSAWLAWPASAVILNMYLKINVAKKAYWLQVCPSMNAWLGHLLTGCDCYTKLIIWMMKEAHCNNSNPTQSVYSNYMVFAVKQKLNHVLFLLCAQLSLKYVTGEAIISERICIRIISHCLQFD